MDGMRPIGRSVASVIVPGLPEPFPFVPERPPRAEVSVPDYPSFCGTDEEFQVANHPSSCQVCATGIHGIDHGSQ
jgi:hypothetical protein